MTHSRTTSIRVKSSSRRNALMKAEPRALKKKNVEGKRETKEEREKE